MREGHERPSAVTTYDENDVEAQRDGFFFKRQGAMTQSTPGRGAVESFSNVKAR